MRKRLIAGLCGLVLLLPATPATSATPAAGAPADAADMVEVRLAYLGRSAPRPPVLSNLEAPPADDGVQGARLGIADNATTGKFLKQRFTLEEYRLEEGGDVAAAVAAIAAAGHRLVVADLDPDGLDAALAAPQAGGLTFLNAQAEDDRFRGEDCRPNLWHLAPSRAMRADALAQVLVAKRWSRWLLVSGPRPGDALFADALRRAAKRFGAKIVTERPWDGSSDLRRSALTEVPVFTQGVDYDVLVVADEAGDFGEYLPYNTFAPRPVAGTQGLVAVSWHRAHEQWGAAQLQNRFRDQAGRRMSVRDHGAWLAVRVVGEAATRVRGAASDPAALVTALADPGFQIAAFKGRPLSFRAWDGQLRQPILVAHPAALVAVAPREGFLHPVNDLDTLGPDAPETRCQRRK